MGCPMTFSDQVEVWFCHQLGAFLCSRTTQPAWIFMVAGATLEVGLNL